MEIFEKKHQTHIALTQDPELRPYWMEFISQIEKLADECASDFIDFNQIPELKSPEWLFYDHFHQNPEGVSHIARAIGEWSDMPSEATL